MRERLGPVGLPAVDGVIPSPIIGNVISRILGACLRLSPRDREFSGTASGISSPEDTKFNFLLKFLSERL